MDAADPPLRFEPLLTGLAAVCPFLELPAEIGEQRIKCTRLGQLLAKQADRVAGGCRRTKVKAKEAQPAQPHPDQVFHPRIADIVLRCRTQDLEYRHSITRRTAALGTVAAG